MGVPVNSIAGPLRNTHSSVLQVGNGQCIGIASCGYRAVTADLTGGDIALIRTDDIVNPHVAGIGTGEKCIDTQRGQHIAGVVGKGKGITAGGIDLELSVRGDGSGDGSADVCCSRIDFITKVGKRGGARSNIDRVGGS